MGETHLPRMLSVSGLWLATSHGSGCAAIEYAPVIPLQCLDLKSDIISLRGSLKRTVTSLLFHQYKFHILILAFLEDQITIFPLFLFI
jgi:hypothetical protein